MTNAVKKHRRRRNGLGQFISGLAGIAGQLAKAPKKRKARKSRTSTAKRHKSGHSGTSTKNKSDVTAMTGHVGGTNSFTEWGRKPQKMSKVLLDNICEPQYYSQTSEHKIVSQVAYQGTGEILTLASVGDVAFMSAQLANSLSQVAGSSSTPAAKRNQFLFMDSVHGMSLFSSCSLQTMDMDIYDVICRNDDAQGPVQDWDFGLVDQALGTQSLFSYKVGCYPQQSKRFGHFWKILKKTHVDLAPGAVHKHVFNYKHNARMNFNMLDSPGSNYRGWTIRSFIVIRGYPVHDSASNLAVAVSDCAVDVVSAFTYKYRYSSTPNQFSYFIEGQSNVPAANQKFVNEFTSVLNVGDPVG